MNVSGERQHDKRASLRVLAVCAFPEEFACTRYRLLQSVEPLRKRGIELTVRPFFTSDEYRSFHERTGVLSRLATIARPLLRRSTDAALARSADVILVQREAMLFGPAFFERLYRVVSGRPMILDLDDAVYIPYNSPKYGRFGSILKFFGKTDRLIRQASLVICGGRFLAEHAEKIGGRAVVIPTIVDNEIFRPAVKQNAVPVVGWIGSASTFPYLEKIFPALQRVAAQHEFVLRLRGSAKDDVAIPGVNVDNGPWTLEAEVEDFRSIDIGLYPLIPNEEISIEWLEGKSGFKAIQYLSLGVPYVVSPVGVAAEIGRPGETHFEAKTIGEWEEKLTRLLSDEDLRRRMGGAGREFSLREYAIEKWADVLAAEIRGIVSSHAD